MKVFSRANLVKAREEAGLTQFQLAAMSGVAQAKISQYENGHTCPSVQKAAALADALGLLVDDLLEEVG
ncbi:helix-turn-helix transcriptional regulator [Streptomyces sp. NPDC093084]|uniref:helix-turn-helix domain-containing protein n=1 Tax=Streptomyces sp. NPDC093084 TaxID=3155197 RepID=UPI00343F02EC